MTLSSLPRPTPSRGRALALLGSAVAVGALVTVGAILPAEYGVDPLGIGRLTGLDRLAVPVPTRIAASATGGVASTANSQSGILRSDIVDIPLGTYDGTAPSELEYKVHLRKGAALVYSWEAPGIDGPQQFYSDFHGHSPLPGNAAVEASYRTSETGRDSGTLTAPFDGVHGWYFQNSSERPVTIRLHLSGFYDLVPAGQPGNEAGLVAKPLGPR
ncbi:MAG TPA: hypothetical protein VF463_00585 [Sphingobium sp.]